MPRLAIFFHLGNHLMFPLLQSYIDLIYSLDYPIDLLCCLSVQVASPRFDSEPLSERNIYRVASGCDF